MQFIKNFMLRYANARKVVVQIKNGEWKCKPLRADTEVYSVYHANGKELWLANGGFFCEIRWEHKTAFGMIWRHYVWHFGAKQLKRKIEKEYNFKGPFLI